MKILRKTEKDLQKSEDSVLAIAKDKTNLGAKIEVLSLELQRQNSTIEEKDFVILKQVCVFKNICHSANLNKVVVQQCSATRNCTLD